MEEEIWKPIRDHPGYEVSNTGRVRSLDRVRTSKDGKVRHLKGRLLKPYEQVTGHLYVYLGRGNFYFVHCLVADAFIGPRPPGAVTRHKDGRPGNNTPENLIYGTQAENLHDVYTYGKRMGCGKLFAEDVRNIRQELADGTPQKVIAAKYSVSRQTISNIKCKRTLYYVD